jgi:hypothetical protein
MKIEMNASPVKYNAVLRKKDLSIVRISQEKHKYYGREYFEGSGNPIRSKMLCLFPERADTDPTRSSSSSNSI